MQGYTQGSRCVEPWKRAGEEPSCPNTTKHRATDLLGYAEIFMQGAWSQPRARGDVASSAPSDKGRLTGWMLSSSSWCSEVFSTGRSIPVQRLWECTSPGGCSAAQCTHILSTELMLLSASFIARIIASHSTGCFDPSASSFPCKINSLVHALPALELSRVA